jgi:NACHT domain
MTMLDRLPTAHQAMHDRVSSCLPGTRKDLLEEIKTWSTSTTTNPMFWLCGPAGMGKSAIASTIANSWRDEGRLGGDFFFSQAIADCRENSKVFPTIASQLATRFPDVFKEPISGAIEQEPDIGSMDVSTQWKVLIKGPLLKVADSLPPNVKTPIVFIFDALDECDSPLPLISSIASDIELLPRNFKFFFSSRPEMELRAAFRRLPVLLRNLAADESSIKEDIEEFVKERMNYIADTFELPLDWPGQALRAKLVEKAEGLFIWVRTAATLIASGSWDDPDTRLQLVLSDSSTGLDRLYSQVLEKAFLSGKDVGTLEQQDLEQYLKIVGAIVTVGNPLSAPAILTLLGLPERGRPSPNAVHLTARKLLAVLIVPDDEGIQLIHHSFADFLTDCKRCTVERLFIDPKLQHQFLAKRCIELMDEYLATFKCDSLDPSKLNSEMEDLTSSYVADMTPAVRYACSYWGYHLQRSQPDEANFGLVKNFYSKHLLCWLEVISLLGVAKSGLDSLRAIRFWLKVYLLVSFDDGSTE